MSLPHGKNHLARLRKAQQISAKVVELYGDKYLPMFIRFSQELAQCEEYDKAMQAALNVAKQSNFGIQNGIQNSIQEKDKDRIS